MDQKSPEAFRTISEVADWLGVPTHVLRFWESRFSQVKPVKRAGGRRYYRPADMELLGGIRQLLHEDGLTIRGVQKLLREKGIKHVAAMSPPLDLSQASAPGNVVDLSDRRAEAVQEAETVEEIGEEPEEKRGFPFDDDTPAPVAEPAEAVVAPEPQPEPMEAVAPQSEPELAETEAPEPVAEPEPVEAIAPEPVAMPEPEPEPAPAPEPIAAFAPDDAPEAVNSGDFPAIGDGLDLSDPLPAPEPMDFMAHDAEPETAIAASETETAAPAAARDTQTDAPDDAPVDATTAAQDPMASPEALDFAAHDAEPVKDEATPPAEAPQAPPRPVVTLPDIGEDPGDEDLESGPLIAARLRAARAQKAQINTAALQAFADRLDEISRRFEAPHGERHL